MNAEIVCVGTELLLGDILNTNARYLSRRLADLGFNVFSQTVVGDNAVRLEKQISLSMARSEILILTGGLGPTADDITKETVAKVLGLRLEQHPESLRRIEEYFARTGRVMSESNRKQALTMEGATVLQNDHGTAPGYLIKNRNNVVVLLPGPPSEMIPMFEDRAVSLLSGYSNQTLISHNVRVFGVGESTVAELCGDLLEQSNPTVATYAKPGEVDIRVTAAAADRAAANRLSAPILERLRDLFGENIYGVDCENLQQATVGLLREKGMRLATAESCTAGLLSSRITEVPGSSEVFEMGVTAYANRIKIEALGVSSELLQKNGAVCGEVAAEMAAGIRMMCGADLGLGITGVAGPGQSEGKPAGLVYIALADREKVYVRKILCRGSDREMTRSIAASTALDMARRYLEGCESLLSFGTVIGAPIRLMEGYSIPKASPAQPAVKANTPQAGENPAQSSAPRAAEESKPAAGFTALEQQDISLIDTRNDGETMAPPEKLDIADDSLGFIFDNNNDGYDIQSISLAAAQNDTDKEKTGEENTVPKKKRNFFTGLFPCKGDPTSEKIRKIIFLVAFVMLIATMVYLVRYFAEGWRQNQINNEAAAVWDSSDSMQKNADGIFIGFESLMAANSDIKAWLKVDGTNINNPVYQTTNNDYYIDHNMNRQESRYGALFIDQNAIIGREKNNQNVVIYGHHMRDGTMFGPLKSYLQLDFYKQHSVIDFTTLYREGKYKVFAVFITNADPKDDNGSTFNYRITDFASEESFLSWIDEVRMRSIINTDVDVQGNDEILTLSTCTYEFHDARLVVMARRIRENETEDIYATNGAALNPNPLYPQAWYDKMGIAKPTFNSSSSSSSSDVLGPDASDVSSEESQPESSSSAPAQTGSSSSRTAGTASSGNTTSSKGNTLPAQGNTTSSANRTSSAGTTSPPSTSKPQTSNSTSTSVSAGTTPQGPEPTPSVTEPETSTEPTDSSEDTNTKPADNGE